MATAAPSSPEYKALMERLDRIQTEQKGLIADADKARRIPTTPARDTIERFAKGQYNPSESQAGPFKTVGQFFKAVRDNGGRMPDAHPQLKAYCDWHASTVGKAAPTGLNETTLGDGSVLVPPQFINQILMRTYANDLMSRVFMLPMTSPVLKVPAINETSRADGSRYGGVQSYWRGEAGSLTASKPSLKQISLTADSLSVYVQVTNEMLEDGGPALETMLQTVVASEFEFAIGRAIVLGNGNGIPQGILNSGSKVAVTRANASLVAPEDIAGMWARLWQGCRQNAIFLYNQEVEPQLMLMTIGLGVSNFPVYLPAGGLSATPYGTLLGRPAIASEFCSALGTAGDIILWDPTTYLMGVRSSMQSAVSIHVLFSTNESVYRFIMRADGKSWWETALTPYKGTNTLSNIVTLAA